MVNSHPLAVVFEPIKQDLKDLDLFLIDHLSSFHLTPVAKEVLVHTFQNGGKRIRPGLFFLSCNLFDYHGLHRRQIGAVCEYVHGASLLHDDVVDQSPTRRGKPTAYSIWGRQAAVLVGDLIYAQASELMTKAGSLDVVAAFAQSIALMSHGELLQSHHCYQWDLPKEIYIQMIYQKTASLVETVCFCSGALAKSSQEKLDAIKHFGRLLGLAFQIIDDALDYQPQYAELFGKEPYGDLREGKVTLPFLMTRHEFQHLPLPKKALSESQVQELAQLVRDKGGINMALAEAEVLTQEAMSYLHQGFEPSQERDQLELLAKTLVSRVF